MPKERDPGLTAFGAEVLQLFKGVADLEVEPTEDIIEQADRIDRPGMLHKIGILYIQGMSPLQIASEVGVTAAAIRNLTKRQTFKAVVTELTEEVVQEAKMIVRVGTHKAARRLNELLDSENEKIQLSAANSLLEKAGIKGAEKIEITNKVDNMAVLTDEQVLMKYLEEIQKLPRPQNVEGVEYNVKE